MTLSRNNGAGIASLINSLHAGHGAEREKVVDILPVIGSTKSQLQHHFIFRLRDRASATLAAQLTRSAPVSLQEGAVESPQAAKACSQRNLGDRKFGFVEQALGEMQTAGLRDRDRRSAHVLHEQAVQ